MKKNNGRNIHTYSQSRNVNPVHVTVPDAQEDLDGYYDENNNWVSVPLMSYGPGERIPKRLGGGGGGGKTKKNKKTRKPSKKRNM